MLLNEIAGPIIKSKWLSPEQKQYVLQHCRPFLEMIDYDLDTYTLYRGVNDNSLSRGKEIAPGMTIKSGHVESRIPKGTPKHVYNEFNNLFAKKFGVPFRNGVFATGNYLWATRFGNTHMVIPIGDFKFCWSPTIRDFGEYIMDNPYSTLTDEDFEVTDNYIQATIDAHIDTDLKRAIKSYHEIAIYCDKCLIISSSSKEVMFGLEEKEGGLFVHAKTHGFVISDIVKSLTPIEGVKFIKELSYNGYNDWSIMTRPEFTLYTTECMLNPKIQPTKYSTPTISRIVYNTNTSNPNDVSLNNLEAYVSYHDRTMLPNEEYIFIPIRRVQL